MEIIKSNRNAIWRYTNKAQQLEFISDSAFIVFFRQVLLQPVIYRIFLAKACIFSLSVILELI